jgi:carbon storage regulator
MLVLARKTDESIFIGDTIRIAVVRIRGDHVRLGIEAPPSVGIYREELLAPQRYGHQDEQGSDQGLAELATKDGAAIHSRHRVNPKKRSRV